MRRRMLFVLLPLLHGAALSAQTPDTLQKLLAAGDSAGLERAIAQALRAPVGNGLLHVTVARIRLDQRRYPQAQAAARLALSSDANYAGIRAWSLVVLGESAFLQGDTAEARARLAEAGALRTSGRPAIRATTDLRILGLDSVYSGWRVLEGGQVRLHLAPGVPDDDVRPWAQRSQTALATMQTFFRAPLPHPIDVFVWSGDAAARAAGLPALARAFMEWSVVHTSLSHTPGHELAHVVSWYAGAGPGPRRRADLIMEGTAVAFDGTARDRLQTARDGMRVAGTGHVSIERLWADGGPDALIYPIGGFFVQRLIDRGGRDRFLRLLADQRLENARALYGDMLTQVMTEVEKELNGN